MSTQKYDPKHRVSVILNNATIRSASVSKDDANVLLAELTISQSSKLVAMMVKVEVKAFKGDRVEVALPRDVIDQLYEDNKRAPRAATSIEVAIASRTVYAMQAIGDAPANTFGEAWMDKVVFDNSPVTGGIEINGTIHPVSLGQASDYYEISEDADPTRTVYVVNVSIDGEFHEFTSYGFTNLLRKLVKIDGVID